MLCLEIYSIHLQNVNPSTFNFSSLIHINTIMGVGKEGGNYGSQPL